MPTTKRRALRDQIVNPDNEMLADGIGGTITGGPMEPIDLMEILARGLSGASRGGAVSGAAQTAAGSPSPTGHVPVGIALSDGSTISFANVADILNHGHAEPKGPDSELAQVTTRRRVLATA